MELIAVILMCAFLGAALILGIKCRSYQGDLAWKDERIQALKRTLTLAEEAFHESQRLNDFMLDHLDEKTLQKNITNWLKEYEERQKKYKENGNEKEVFFCIGFRHALHLVRLFTTGRC